MLPLRGDLQDDSKFYDFKHSDELTYYIKKNHPEFTLFGTCYPEGHPESSCVQQDIDVMKRKQDFGADYFVTQLFLDNNYFKSVR